jgi:hypothetical protein
VILLFWQLKREYVPAGTRYGWRAQQTDARPSRDGSEQFGSGTQAYGQI